MRGFIGIDLETTGLEPSAHILEMGAVLFDHKLNEVDRVSVVAPDEAGHIAVHHGDIDDFIRDMHGKSGLLDEILAMDKWDSTGLSRFSAVLEHWVDRLGGKVPMLGSSVHADRAWLQYSFPHIHRLFHYRNVDASTLKELATVADPERAKKVLEGQPEQSAHRSVDDVLASADTIKRLASKSWFHAPGAALR